MVSAMRVVLIWFRLPLAELEAPIPRLLFGWQRNVVVRRAPFGVLNSLGKVSAPPVFAVAFRVNIDGYLTFAAVWPGMGATRYNGECSDGECANRNHVVAAQVQGTSSKRAHSHD